jgi:hypothetical protein
MQIKRLKTKIAQRPLSDLGRVAYFELITP